MTLHYHGSPITPRAVYSELAGRCFCVPFSDARDAKVCHQVGQSVMLDNGAYSFWTNNVEPDWDAYADWAEEWLDWPTTWCVIPDMVDGGAEANDRLLISWFQRRLAKGAPVWHMDEPLERLQRLAHGYERVCFGSAGAYRQVGSDPWHRRCEKAFNAVSDGAGRVPWVHMLRGMSLAGSHYPFGSVDSTDLARNHNQPWKTPVQIAERWDGLQCPPRWVHVDQLEMVV